MNKCPKCGQEVESKFCPDCGINVQEPLKCPKCGAVMKGRFCPDCGHDSQAKEKGKFIGKIKSIFNKCKDFFMANMKKCIVIGASALAAIILAIVLIVTLSNIFRVGKVSKIDIGTSKSKVIDILGEPTVDDERTLYWYESKVAKKLEKALEIEDEFEFLMDEDELEELAEKYDKIYAEIEEMTYKFIMVKLDGDDKVTSVFLDKNHKYDENDDYATEEKEIKKIELGMQNVSVISTTRDGELEITLVSSPNKIKYIVKFKDGSYCLDSTYQSSMSITADESTATIKWDDRIAEYEVQKPVVVTERYIVENGVTYNADGTTALSCEQSIKVIRFREGVTTVEQGFFEGLAFSEIYIPNSMKTLNIENFDDFAIEKATVPVSYIKVLPKETLKDLIINEGATSVGGASGFTKLASVTIPESATAISAEAFKDCSSLAQITIPKNIASIGTKAFEGCVKLMSVYDLSDALEIKKDAGNGMVGYYSIQILNTVADNQGDFLFITENGVHYLNGYVGNDSTIVLPVDYKGNKYKISSLAFSNPVIKNVTLSESVKTIESQMFKECTSLMSIIIPNNVTSIEANAFYGCKSLASVTIPNSVTSIGYAAFAYCDSLTSVTIPNSVTSIDKNAFFYCNSLISVIIPDSVINIGQSAFACSSLTAYCEAGCKTGDWNSDWNWETSSDFPIHAHAVWGYEKYAIIDGIAYGINDGSATIVAQSKSLKEIIIPESINYNGVNYTVSSIASDAFNNCQSLTSISAVENNKLYKSIDGNLYSKDGKTLIKYAPGKEDIYFIVPDNIISIENYAFADCSYLKFLIIGEQVTDIGSAFKNPNNGYYYNPNSLVIYCVSKSKPSGWSSDWNFVSSGVEFSHSHPVVWGYEKYFLTYDDTMKCEIMFGLKDNVATFTKQPSVITKEVIIPNSIEYADGIYFPVTAIEVGAFSNYGSLTSVTIGNSVTSIGVSAFSGFTSLTSVTIGDSVTSIGKDAFYNCTSLTSVTIGDSVTEIGNRAFQNCTSLTSVTIPNSVTSIGEDAFLGCASLTSITIPDSVTSIGEYAFLGCASLTSVTIPNSVTLIGDGAFEDCTSLTSIEVDKNNEAYKSIDGNLYSKDGKTLIQYALGKKDTSFVIPNSVTSIGRAAFYGCTSLTSVTIGDSVTSIGRDAFSRCTSLTSVTIGDSVTEIGNRAFQNCTSLTSVTIPNSVTKIGDRAFYGCSKLKVINCEEIIRPYGWDSNWKSGCNATVVWGYKGE